MPIDDDIWARLHHLDGFIPQAEWPPSPDLLARLRALSAPIGDYSPPCVPVRERVIPGPHGDIRLRIYQPPAPDSSGIGLVWLHGGGFATGDLDMPEADTVARELCLRTGTTVVSVDYHLARGGMHFPVPLDDVMATWRWLVDASEQLGIDRAQLSMGGASAGGNLAAGSALALRDQGSVQPRRLILAYPVLHYRLPPSVDELPSDIASVPTSLRFTPEAVATIGRNYIGEAATPTPYAFPALGYLAGMPASAILTSEYDDLRSSGEAFAVALKTAGVDVVLRREPGAIHGHLNIAGSGAFERSLRFIARVIAGDVGIVGDGASNMPLSTSTSRSSSMR